MVKVVGDGVGFPGHGVAGHQRENQARANRRKVKSRLHDAVIRVYDDGGNVIETYEHARQI